MYLKTVYFNTVDECIHKVMSDIINNQENEYNFSHYNMLLDKDNNYSNNEITKEIMNVDEINENTLILWFDCQGLKDMKDYIKKWLGYRFKSGSYKLYKSDTLEAGIPYNTFEFNFYSVKMRVIKGGK